MDNGLELNKKLEPMASIGFIGFWKRVCAQGLELIIFMIPNVFMYRFCLKLSLENSTVLPFVLFYVIYYAIVIILTKTLGASIGKLAFGYSNTLLPKANIYRGSKPLVDNFLIFCIPSFLF